MGRYALLGLVTFVGCAEPPAPLPLPLAEWRGVYVWSDSRDGAADINVTIWSDIDDVNRAPSSDMTATIDGIPMRGPGPVFALDGLPEMAGATSTIVIADTSARWTISVPDLATNDIAVSAAPAFGEHVRAMWPSAGGMNERGDTVELYQDDTYVWSPPRTPIIRDGIVVLDIDLGNPPSWVQANTLAIGAGRSYALEAGCEGPIGCLVMRQAHARFGLRN